MTDSGHSDVLLAAHQGLRSVWSRLRLLPAPSPAGYFYAQWLPEADSKERTETHIWRELAATEVAYITKLKLATTWSTLLKLNVANNPQLTSAFATCHDLCIVHQRMIELLDVTGTATTQRVKVLSLLCENLGKYDAYTSLFYAAIEEVMRTRKEFDASAYATAQAETGVELEVALMPPLQRVPVYLMQLQELQRATPRYSPEQAALREATKLLIPLTKGVVVKIKFEIQRLSAASLKRMHTPRQQPNSSPTNADTETEIKRLHERIHALEAEVDGLRRKLSASQENFESKSETFPPNLVIDTNFVTPRKGRKAAANSENSLPVLTIEPPTGQVYRSQAPTSILEVLERGKEDDVELPEARVTFIPPRRASLAMKVSFKTITLIHQKFGRILGRIRSREQVLKRVKIAIDMKEERDTTKQSGLAAGLMMLEQEKKKEDIMRTPQKENSPQQQKQQKQQQEGSGEVDLASLVGEIVDPAWEPHVYGDWTAVWDSVTGNVFFRKRDLSAQTWDCPPEIVDKLEGEDKWAMLMEQSSGLVYFHNRQKPGSGTTWTCPEELRKQPVGKKRQTRIFQNGLREVQKVLQSAFVVGFAPITAADISALDFEMLKTMCVHFHTQTLSGPAACQMLARAFPLLIAEDNVVFISRDSKPDSRVIVVGDIHGQLGDLEIILEQNGFPSPQNKYVFNGDIVDRGPHSVECLFVMLALKILAPDCVVINRGNHEARNMNMVGGFWEEVCQRYDAPFFNLFSDFMGCLPMCTVIDKRIFVVHAGLFKKDAVTLDQILAFRRFHNEPPPGSLLEDMLWSDPMMAPGRKESQRGAGCRFGPDVCDRFLADNRLELVLRSHEVCDNGWEEVFPNRLYTVFSASNYCDEVGNKGAVAVVKGPGLPEFVEYSTLEGAVCHPELWSPASMVPSSPGSMPGSPLSLGPSRSPQMSGKKLHDNILDKLKARIALNRALLLKEFDAIAETESSSDLSDDDDESQKKKNKRPTKKGSTVHRLLWADVMKTVLELDIPWLQMQQELVGHTRPMVDYKAFLDVFKIKHRTFSNAPHNHSEHHNEQAKELMAEVAALLFNNKMHMTYLFKYLDQDGDGQVSRAEFQSGITSLLSLIHVQHGYDDALISDMMDLIDTDGSGSIDYEEFFAGFKPQTDSNITDIDHTWIETDISSLLKEQKKK